MATPTLGHVTRSLQRYATDPLAFRDALLIDANGDMVRFASVVDPLQAKDFQALDVAFKRLVGFGNARSGHKRFYFQRCRGSSKTTDLAAQAAWLIGFSTKRLGGLAAAGSREQARHFLEALDRLLDSNAYLKEFLTLERNRVFNERTKSELKVISADAGTSYGHLGIDFILVDELAHWKEAAGEDLELEADEQKASRPRGNRRDDHLCTSEVRFHYRISGSLARFLPRGSPSEGRCSVRALSVHRASHGRDGQAFQEPV